MDPEPEMLAAAHAEARTAGIVLTLVLGGSEDLGPHLGRFRLVTMGRSFHWMDRDRTLVALDALIEPDGAIGLFDVDHPEVADNAWYPAWKAVRDRYTPPSRRRDGSAEEKHEAVLSRSVFSVLRRLAHRWRQSVSMDDLVGRTLSGPRPRRGSRGTGRGSAPGSRWRRTRPRWRPGRGRHGVRGEWRAGSRSPRAPLEGRPAPPRAGGRWR